MKIKCNVCGELNNAFLKTLPASKLKLWVSSCECGHIGMQSTKAQSKIILNNMKNKQTEDSGILTFIKNEN